MPVTDARHIARCVDDPNPAYGPPELGHYRQVDHLPCRAHDQRVHRRGRGAADAVALCGLGPAPGDSRSTVQQRCQVPGPVPGQPSARKKPSTLPVVGSALPRRPQRLVTTSGEILTPTLERNVLTQDKVALGTSEMSCSATAVAVAMNDSTNGSSLPRR